MQYKNLKIKFEDCIKENELLIYKVCRIYTRTEEDKQDLFQDIVIQLWHSYSNFRGECKLSTWLYRIAIYTAITKIRKEKNLTVAIDNETLSKINTPTDESFKEKEERFLQMYEAIDTLNNIDKAIVMLYLENKSYEEMEDILGITQVNLRVKMNRIKEKLRQLTKNK